MAVRVSAAFAQEMEFLANPVALCSATFGVLGYGVSLCYPIKPGAGFIWGLSGALVATVALPIFELYRENRPLGVLDWTLYTSFAVLISGGFLTEILLGIYLGSVGLYTMPFAIEILVIGYIAKMLARMVIETYQTLR